MSFRVTNIEDAPGYSAVKVYENQDFYISSGVGNSCGAKDYNRQMFCGDFKLHNVSIYFTIWSGEDPFPKLHDLVLAIKESTTAENVNRLTIFLQNYLLKKTSPQFPEILKEVERVSYRNGYLFKEAEIRKALGL